jgi:hypothetical protein
MINSRFSISLCERQHRIITISPPRRQTCVSTLFGDVQTMQKRENCPFSRLFQMQFTLFQTLHFSTPINSDSNNRTLVNRNI